MKKKIQKIFTLKFWLELNFTLSVKFDSQNLLNKRDENSC